jgi:hypothetical protein
MDRRAPPLPPRPLPVALAPLRPPVQRAAVRHTSVRRTEAEALVRRWVQPRAAACSVPRAAACSVPRAAACSVQQEAARSVQQEALRLLREPPTLVSSNSVWWGKPKGPSRELCWPAQWGPWALVWGRRRGPEPVATSRLTPVTMPWRTRRAHVASCVHLRKVPMNFACLPLLTVRVSVNRRIECGRDSGTC